MTEIVEVFDFSSSNAVVAGSGLNAIDLIDLNGNISNLGAADRRLTILANGTLSGDSNIGVTLSGPNDVIVDDVISDGNVRMQFLAPRGTIRGDAVLHLDKVIDVVEITNLSNRNLILGEIQMISPSSSSEPDLVYRAANPSYFAIDSELVHSSLTIDSQGSGHVVFTRPVSNVSAAIEVTSGGDILAASNAVYLRSGDVEHLRLEAGGSIGTVSQTLNVYAVRGKLLPNRTPSPMPAEIIARAGDGIYLQMIGVNSNGFVPYDAATEVNGIMLNLHTTTGDIQFTAPSNVVLDFAGGAHSTGVQGSYHILNATAPGGNISLNVARGDLVIGKPFGFTIWHPDNDAVGSIAASGSVTLLASRSILDQRGGFTADVSANQLTVLAGEDVGSPGDPLETNVTRLVGQTGGSIDLVEVTGNIILGNSADNFGLVANTLAITTFSGALIVEQQVRAAGNIYLTTRDQATSGQNLTVTATGSVTSTNENVYLLSGDDLTIAAGSSLQATNDLVMQIDYINLDASGGLATVNGSIAAARAIVLGDRQSDRLVVTTSPAGGSDVDWRIEGLNFGSVANSFSFALIENLTSGSGSDQFVFADGAGITGTIDGGTGTDWLDYSAYSTGVTVNLQSGANQIGTITAVENVLGGMNADNLIGSNAGSNTLLGGPGNDALNGGGGDDLLVGGLGNDVLDGAGGNDVLFGGGAFGTLQDYQVGTSDFELPPGLQSIEDAYSSNPANFGRGVTAADPITHAGRFSPPILSPAILAGLSLDGDPADGSDTLTGGIGSDIMFGGSEVDVLDGAADNDYLDAGAGDDVSIDGGAGNDIVRGGAGSDVLHGGAGIDLLYGDAGNDRLFGDAGDGTGRQAGQRLFGGDGDDELFAYATAADGLPGDQLFGEAGSDTLRGNLRSDLLVGGAGDDTLLGDGVTGAAYALNTAADVTGSGDLLYGDSGSDQVYGGGGADEIWGGAGNDLLDGQDGQDRVFGGLGIDLFVLPLHLGTGSVPQAGAFPDEFHGHYGNRLAGDIADDNATDILLVDGSQFDDAILFSQESVSQASRLRVDYHQNYTNASTTNATLFVNMFDAAGRLRVEKIQAAGLQGDDVLGFVTSFTDLPASVSNPVALGQSVKLDVARLATERPQEFIGSLDDNSGDDVLIGSGGRDQLNGGIGSDILYGLAGDDRLFGDRNGEGVDIDHDVLYAGAGNDDALGGSGSNEPYAWSIDPHAGSEFGVFVDPASATGQLFNDSNGGLYVRENTGLNRLLGGEDDDDLYGGTGLDFMYGRGGDNTLYRADGTSFSSMDGGLAGEDWKEYARESDQVWYVGGTNANDEIRVDFVTEPGLLSDHHLITRLTENNGNFSFAASVRLDVTATDGDGNSLWDPSDLAFDFNELLAAQNEEERGEQLRSIAQIETDLINNLLPPEGEFLVILIDALDGNDQVFVGPTVQKSVWVDAGAGDDRVEIQSGNAILVDQTENGIVNGLRGRNDSASQAFILDVPSNGAQFDRLTIDSPNDVDWFAVELPSLSGDINLTTASLADQVTLRLFGPDRVTDPSALPLAAVSGPQSVALDLSDLYAASVQQANPLLYYRFNESAGTLAVDASGNGNNGTLNGAVGLQQPSVHSQLGNSFGFNGTNSSVTVPALGTFDKVTVETWINSAALAAGCCTSIFSTNNYSTGNLHYNLIPGNVVEHAMAGSDPSNFRTPAGLVQNNTWHHVVTTYDSTNGQTNTYIDAELAGSTTRTTRPAMLLDGGRIGAWNSSRYFSGRIDEFAIYDSVLTPQTIASHYTIGSGAFQAGETYLIQVETNQTPTIYGLEFDFGGTSSVVDLGLRGTSSERRDIILGGEGRDILQGGGGEDWIFGGAGNDVLTGGADRQASDLLFGEDGQDTFQLIPGYLPRLGNSPGTIFSPTTGTIIPAYSDQFDGGAGEDRVLFLGGDIDRRGFDVPDYAALRYDPTLGRYEFTSLVWDIGLQEFRTQTDAGGNVVYQQQYAFYQAQNIENTELNTQNGNDVVRVDPGFQFSPLAEGLTARYRFDNGTASDSSHTNHGILQNGAAISHDAERGSSVLRLDGTNDFVNLPDTVLTPSGGTVSLWFKPDTTTGSRMVFGSASAQRAHLEIVNGALQARVRGDTFGNTAVQANTWIHAALTWNAAGITPPPDSPTICETYGTMGGWTPSPGYPIPNDRKS